MKNKSNKQEAFDRCDRCGEEIRFDDNFFTTTWSQVVIENPISDYDAGELIVLASKEVLRFCYKCGDAVDSAGKANSRTIKSSIPGVEITME
jgi:hypothetical protein